MTLMNEREEFDFWLGEYANDPRWAAAEVKRLLDDMCQRGNALALAYAFQQQLGGRGHAETESALGDVLDLMTSSLASASVETSTSPDDLDGNEWAADTGHIDRETAFPTGSPETEESGDYSPNWSDIACSIKEQRRWRCETCGFEAYGSSLIQVHHINRNKTDNSVANLQVLCAACHGMKHIRSPLWPPGTPAAEIGRLESHHRAWRMRLKSK